jgi:hypothetical protein
MHYRVAFNNKDGGTIEGCRTFKHPPLLPSDLMPVGSRNQDRQTQDHRIRHVPLLRYKDESIGNDEKSAFVALFCDKKRKFEITHKRSQIQILLSAPY